MSFMEKCPAAVSAYRQRFLGYLTTAFTEEDIAAACPSPDTVLPRRPAPDDVEVDDHGSLVRGERRKKEVRVRDQPTNGAPSKRKRTTAPRPDASDSDDDPKNGADMSDDDEPAVNNNEMEFDDGMDDLDVSGENNNNVDDERPAKRTKPSPPTAGMSQYEIDRLENIARNKEILKSIGLEQAAQNFEQSLKAPAKKPVRKPVAPRAVEPRRSKRIGGSAGDEMPRTTSPPPSQGADTLAIPAARAAPQTRPKPRQARLSTEERRAIANPAADVSEMEVDEQEVAKEPEIPAKTVNDLGIGEQNFTPTPQRDTPDDGGGDEQMDKPSDAVDMVGLFINEETLLEEAAEAAVEAPAYLADVLSRMDEKEMGVLGQRWKTFVADMVLLEAEEFNVPLKDLPVGSEKDGTKRPPLLHKWLRTGRCRRNDSHVPKEMPLLPPEDLSNHIESFMGWWGMMQPTWRRRDGKVWARNGYDEEKGLGDLNTRGSCGWLSIVAVLWWWGLCVHEGENQDERTLWDEALTDASWMLRVVRIRGVRPVTK